MARPKKSAQPKNLRTVVRDAVTGRFAPKSAAKRRPKSTVVERIRLGRGRTKKRK